VLLVHETLEGFRLLDDGEILTLEILHQGDLGVATRDADRRQDQQADLLGRQVAPLPGDDVEPTLVGRSEEERREDTVLFDRGGQLGQGVGIDNLPGLVGIQFEVDDGNVVKFAFLVNGHGSLSSLR